MMKAKTMTFLLYENTSIGSSRLFQTLTYLVTETYKTPLIPLVIRGLGDLLPYLGTHLFY